MAEEAKQIFRSEGEFQIWNLTKKKEITPYTTSCTWTGALECAARSIDFSIAYTTPKKDASFQNLKIELGDRVQMRFIDNNKKEFRLFEGNVFLRNRNSESYTMEFKAFDDVIYLAKSEVQMKFSKMPGADIIRQVCGTFGINMGTIHEDFNTECDFIADGITATEVINKCCKECEARYGYKYKAVMLPDKNGKQVLNVVRADGSDAVANYKVSDTTNLERAQHGESIEDMVNQVAIVNDNGDISGYIKNEDDIKKYGLIQKIYKHNQKADAETEAKLLLQKVKEHSSLAALGNIQCVSGYVVEVEEEQIKGKFMIISDSHKIERGQHHMELTLDYIETPKK